MLNLQIWGKSFHITSKAVHYIVNKITFHLTINFIHKTGRFGQNNFNFASPTKSLSPFVPFFLSFLLHLFPV